MRALLAVLAVTVALVVAGAWWAVVPDAGVLAAPSVWPVIGGGAVEGFGLLELVGAMALAATADVLALGRRVGRSEGLGIAVVAAIALVGASPLATLLVGAAGGAATVALTRGSRRAHLVVRMVESTLLPAVLWVVTSVGGPRIGGAHGVPVTGLLTVAVLVLLVGSVVEAWETRLGPPSRWLDVEDVLRAEWGTKAVVAATACLGALTYPAMGWPALVLVVLPLQTVRAGFRLRNEGALAVEQTLAAMARVPEWIGVVESGHAERTVAAAEAAAAELSLPSAVRRDLLRAAHAHELGCLDRIAVEEQLPVAESTAAVLAEAGVSDRVLAIVRGGDVEGPEAVRAAARVLEDVCRLLRAHPERAAEDVGRQVGRELVAATARA